MAFRQQPAQTEQQPAALGLAESLRGGVTALGDIVQPGEPLVASPIDITALLELIAPTADRVATAVELAKAHLADKNVCLTARNVGLSPHAPYSVHPDLLAAVVELSQRHKIPVAMHLAESPEELELLRHGGGPLRGFLEERGAWDATAIPRGARPLDYLRLLARTERALVIHGNFLDDEEISLLGAAADRMSVVYCPRTHDWFAHRDYPLEKLLAAGATVALGTDGRGSSPDLSLLGEMRFAARKHPGVPLAAILRMATIAGARALGRETEIGSLAAGKRADLAIVALPDRSADDPHELLFDPAASVVACYCRGAEAYRSGNAAIS
jgi:cytosine/adenosine deaminase-related metal-dependent hydrolase